MSLIQAWKAGVALTTLVVAAPCFGNSTGLFPSSLLSETRSCDGDSKRSEPALSQFESEWFSAHLTAFGERALADAGGEDAIRFLWLRTFHHPVMVRLDGLTGGSPTLTAVELTGAGGYEPGSVGRRIHRELTNDEVMRVNRSLTSTSIFVSPKAYCGMGFDGSEWIIESSNDGDYHFVKQWSPSKGPVHAVGVELLDLTGWDFGPRY